MAIRVDVTHETPSAIRRTVVGLAIPAVSEMLLQTSGWVIDTAFVGRLGAEYLAAVALAGQVYFTLVFAFGAVGIGATALLARYTGAGDQKSAIRASGQIIRLSLLLGALAMLSVRLLAPLVFRASGIEPHVMSLALRYTRLLSLGAVLQVFMLGISGVLRGHGNTRSPFVITLVSNSVGILAEYILIFGIGRIGGLGFVGAALGLLTGWFVGAVVALVIAFGGSTRVASAQDLLSASWGDSVRVLRLAFPAGMETLLMDGARTVNMMFMAVLGTTSLAAFQIVAAAESLSFMPGYGFAIASSVVTGQALGAGDASYAKTAANVSWRIALTIMGSIGATYVLFPGVYVSLFGRDAEVFSLARVCLAIAGIAQPFIATTEVHAGVLRGAGDIRASMYITMAGTWLVRVPLTYLVARKLGLGLEAVWAVMVLDWFVRSILARRRFLSGRWAEVGV